MTSKHGEAQQKYLQPTLENSKVNCMVWAAAIWFHMPAFISAASRQCWMCPSCNCSWYQSICTQHSISYILVIHVQFHSIMISTYWSLLKMRPGGNVSYKCHRNEWCEDQNGCRRAHSSDDSFYPYSFSNDCFCVLLSTF